MISKKVIENALALLAKRTTNYEYFFSQLKSPDWIAPLKENGYFETPPEPEKDGDHVRFPFWPESQYLARVASLAPDEVLEIALLVGPKAANFRVHADFNEAAARMPPEHASKWARSETKWIQSQRFVYYLSDSLIILANHLSRNSKVSEALGLLGAVLAATPTEKDGERIDYTGRPPYATRIDSYDYGKVLTDCVPHLMEGDGEKTIQFLCRLLVNTFRAGKGNEDELFMIWRPAIEESEQNRNGDRIESLLVTAIRDTSEQLMPHSGEAVLSIVEGFDSPTLLRISLYLRTKYPGVDRKGTEKHLADEKVLTSHALHHELYRLLETTFGEYDKSAQDKYIEFAGKEDLPQGYAEWFAKTYGKDLTTDGESSRQKRHMRYRRLYPVRKYLTGEMKTEFDTMMAEFKELEHPDFECYTSSVWCGPTSPRDSKSIDSMSIAEIVSFLHDWKPRGDIFDETPEGLGRQLAESVKNTPERFADSAESFTSVDPTYLRAVLHGLRESVQNNKEFRWEKVLALCNWVVSQPTKIEGRKAIPHEMDPDWQWTRREIGSLLEVGLKKCSAEIPVLHRSEVWKILEVLSEDSDPTPDYEETYGCSNMDPATLSINTTRGTAFHAVVQYALWVRRDEERNKKRELGFGSMPEVRSCLERHLDTAIDPSFAVRSVYGQYLPWLIMLDENWCHSHIGQMLPKQEERRSYYLAAWCTFLSFCRPYKNVFRVLLPEYEFAIDNPPDNAKVIFRLLKPAEKIGEHIMLYYLWGMLDISRDSIVDGLFTKYDEESRRHALEFVGRCLHFEGSKMPEVEKDRAKELWDWRMRKLTESGVLAESKEPDSFDWWFSSNVLDGEWVLDRMIHVAKSRKSVKLDYKVAERFPLLVVELPTKSLECLGLLIKRDNQEWGFHDYKGSIKNTLQLALDSPDSTVREKAREIVDVLGAKGNLEFRKLTKK